MKKTNGKESLFQTSPDTQPFGILELGSFTITKKPVFTEPATIEAMKKLNVKAEDLVISESQESNVNVNVYVENEKKRLHIIEKIIFERARILDEIVRTKNSKIPIPGSHLKKKTKKVKEEIKPKIVNQPEVVSKPAVSNKSKVKKMPIELSDSESSDDSSSQLYSQTRRLTKKAKKRYDKMKNEQERMEQPKKKKEKDIIKFFKNKWKWNEHIKKKIEKSKKEYEIEKQKKRSKS